MRKRSFTWEPFRAGVVLAGMRVLEVIEAGATMRETRYVAAHTCCGRERETTHLKLRERERKGRSLCERCAGRLNAQRANEAARVGAPRTRPDVAVRGYGVIPPPWPPVSGSLGRRWYGGKASLGL